MNWKDDYKARSTDAAQAATLIRNGSRVVVGHAVGEPSHLLDTIVEHAEDYRDVVIIHMLCMGQGRYCQPGMEHCFRHNSLFVGGAARDAVSEGRADFTPCYFSEIPGLFSTGALPVDVALIQVSPPDNNGYCSLESR